jgi:HAD superfamily phosphoserine phosphatase-like hydrolase
MTHIAAFDCDGTLIRGDATRCFLLLLRGPFGLAQDLCTLVFKLLCTGFRGSSTAQLKAAVLDRALQAAPLRRREAALRQLPAILIAQLRPQALARLRWHQQHGHRCLIVSASPQPLIAPLASHLGVELIATGCSDLQTVGSSNPFVLTTPNCKGPEKLCRLELYLGYLPQPQDLESYGDSRGDRHLLQMSGQPHWRSFGPDTVHYPASNTLRWLLPLLAMCLVLTFIYGIRLAASDLQASFLANGRRLLRRLPEIYGLLALSYLGRYARWRVLLGSVGVGHWGLADAHAWFRGFALTVSPGKLGELTRVADFHRQFQYPRLAMLQTFMAERACDVLAVALWLLLLFPRQP